MKTKLASAAKRDLVIPVLFSTLALAAALAGAWMLRTRAYARFFRYAADRGQRYDFPKGDTTAVNVNLAVDGFVWPEEGDWDTALLELPIECTPLGHWTEPWIEVRTRHFYARQYFERGARGTRYMNLSALLEEPPTAGQQFWLHGFGLAWTPQPARSLLFSNRWPARPRSVVIAPHPDDAEIAAFGLYRNSDSVVVTLTAGDLGDFYRGQLPVGDERIAAITARVRAWDSITAPMFGEVDLQRAVNLGYFDSTLEKAFGEPETPVALPGSARTIAEIRRLNLSPLIDEVDVPPTWQSLVRDLARIIEKTNPEVIATPHPLLDDHPDHAFATVAVCEALAQLGPREGRLLLYTNHTPWTNLHPIGQNDGAVSLPPHFGESLPFCSIKSLPLSADDQRLKLLALESHHDLRSLPALRRPGCLAQLRAFASGLHNCITGLDGHATSYFRRAVRPNELFFVVPFADASALRTQFLTEWRAGKIEWHRCH
jgi:LmbE family N-acetylglucosaminyl deacetylase